MRALFLFRDENCDWWWSPTSSSSPTFSEFHQSPSDFIRVSIADHLNTSSRFKNVITNTLGAASASFTMWLWPCVGGWLEKKTRSYFSSRATQARLEKKMLYSHSHKTFFQFFSVDWRNSVKPGLKSLRLYFDFGFVAVIFSLVWA